jgi:hypothetical protein
VLVAVRVTRRGVSFEVIEEAFTFWKTQLSNFSILLQIASAARIQCLQKFICRVLSPVEKCT